MKSWQVLFLGIAVSCFWQMSSVALAEEKTPDNPMNWEISALPKPTPEEAEAMRWAPVMENDTASYAVETKSLKRNTQDNNQVNVNIKAIYKDPKLLAGLNNRYKAKLAKHDSVAYSEMLMDFQLLEKTYAVTECKVYSKQGILIETQKREKKFMPVPGKTFADTMYELCRAMAQNGEI